MDLKLLFKLNYRDLSLPYWKIYNKYCFNVQITLTIKAHSALIVNVIN